MTHRGTASILGAAKLKLLLHNLNLHLRNNGHPELTYALLGEPLKLSKESVSALFNGTYPAATASKHLRRLGELLLVIAETRGLSIDVFNPRVTRRRVSPEGYLKFARRTYYAGSLFRSEVVTIQRVPDSHEISITGILGTRTLQPIDPTNNQLGYTPNS